MSVYNPTDHGGKCPVETSGSGWSTHSWRCGKPIKRDGMCGIHAAAVERRARNDAARTEEWQRQEAARISARAAAERLRPWLDGACLPVDHRDGTIWLTPAQADALAEILTRGDKGERNEQQATE